MSELTIYRWLLRLSDPDGYSDLPTARLHSSQIGKLIEVAGEHGVTSTVLRNLRQVLEHEEPGTLLTNSPDGAATALAVKQAEEDLLPEIAQTLLLRARTRSLLAAMQSEGVDAAVVKGEDFADRLYKLPGLRTFRDIDLLLRREQIDSLDALMQRHRFQFLHPEGKYNEDYGERTWDSIDRPRVRVEFHWNMINCPSQRQYSSLAWDDLQWTQKGDRWQASTESMVLIACAHAAISHRFDRLQHLCDIRQICRQLTSDFDFKILREMTLRCGVASAVTGALEVTARLLNDADVRRTLKELKLPTLRAPWQLLVSDASLLAPPNRMTKLRRTVIREWMKRAA